MGALLRLDGVYFLQGLCHTYVIPFFHTYWKILQRRTERAWRACSRAVPPGPPETGTAWSCVLCGALVSRTPLRPLQTVGLGGRPAPPRRAAAWVTDHDLLVRHTEVAGVHSPSGLLSEWTEEEQRPNPRGMGNTSFESASETYETKDESQGCCAQRVGLVEAEDRSPDQDLPPRKTSVTKKLPRAADTLKGLCLEVRPAKQLEGSLRSASALAPSAQRALHLTKASQTFLPKAQRRTCFTTLQNQGSILLSRPGSSGPEGLLQHPATLSLTDSWG